ncbi:hypothetical protein [Halorientalis salina]|uniref:hypothetical protein n=1 Tax=Halorientalis salina TaxID=2932266 RepID=UPI0010AB71E3|nr:hypothetical protein [Halorientalis salina]
MTEDNDLLESFMDGSTRRSVLKTGTLATAGLALGTGTATAQEDDGDGGGLGEEYDKALMFADQFNPNSKFVISSPVLQWNPNVQEVREAAWSEYNTRMIRYLNTGQRATFFQAEAAEVPEFDQEAGYVVDAEGDTSEQGTPQPEVFDMHQEWAPFGASRLVTVNFTPVGEDEEDALLEQEDWWTQDGGGQTPTGQTPQ